MSPRKTDTDKPTGPRAYYITAHGKPVCFVAAVNSAMALIAADKLVHARNLYLNGKPSPSTMSPRELINCLQTFSVQRWRECPTLTGELVDGEVIDLTDPDCIGQWWESLSAMRLIDGTPDNPAVTHQPPAHKRAYRNRHSRPPPQPDREWYP